MTDQEYSDEQKFKKREDMAREIFLKTYDNGDSEDLEMLSAIAILSFEIAEMFFDTAERRRG